MSKSVTIHTPTFDECIDLIATQGAACTYVVCIDGEIITLPGETMRGFLLPSDRPDWFMRF